MSMRDLALIRWGGMPLEEFLKAMDISPCRLAKDISASRRRIGEILRAKRVVTADTALFLGW